MADLDVFLQSLLVFCSRMKFQATPRAGPPLMHKHTPRLKITSH